MLSPTYFFASLETDRQLFKLLACQFGHIYFEHTILVEDRAPLDGYKSGKPDQMSFFLVQYALDTEHMRSDPYAEITRLRVRGKENPTDYRLLHLK